MSQAQRKMLCLALQQDHGFSERRSCRVVQVARSTLNYVARPRDDAMVMAAVSDHIRDNAGTWLRLAVSLITQHRCAMG